MEKWKKFWSTHWQYIVVVIMGVILSVGIWGRVLQIATGDDYAFHVTRLQSAAKGWANGQVVPQVDPDTLDGFGYAYNLFYGPLVTYVTAAVQALVGAWPVAVNIVLVLCVILSGLIMCRTMLKISRNPVLAMMVAVIYMASPYFLNNLYSRMAVGEIVAFVSAPILLLGLYQLMIHDKHASRNIAISAALLVLSHSLSAMLFAIMAGVFVLLNLKRIVNWENIWRMLLGVVVALGLTAFFTLPLIEAKMTGIYGVFNEGYSRIYFGANPQSMNDHRLWPNQLMAVDYSASADDGLNGENDLALGIIVWIGLLGFWFARKKIENRAERSFVTSLYIISILAILVTLPLINWHYVPSILWQMQFPWRMLMIVALAMSVVSGYTVYGFVRGIGEDKQKIAAVAVGMLAIYLVTPVIIPDPSRKLDTVEEVAKDPVVIGWEGEYAPMQLLCSPDDEDDVKQGYACSLSRIRERLVERGKEVKVLSGGVIVERSLKDGLKMRITVNNLDSTTAKLELPLIYYLGYKAVLNGDDLKVGYSQEYGLVTVEVPAGAKGEISVKYGMSFATQIGLMISSMTAGLGLIWVVWSGINDRIQRKKRREELSPIDEVREVVDIEQDDAEMLAELKAEQEQNEADAVATETAEPVVLPEPPAPVVPEMMAEIGTVASAEEVAEPQPKPRKRSMTKTTKTPKKAGTTTAKKTTVRAAKTAAKPKASTATKAKSAKSTTTKTMVKRAKAKDDEKIGSKMTTRRSTTTRVRTVKDTEDE